MFILSFALVSASGVVSCTKRSVPYDVKTPRYLLTGERAGDDSRFIYYSIDNGNAYAIALKETLRSSEAEITFDSDNPKYNNKPITGIWRNGFESCQASSITIPIGITTIDYEAFMGCSFSNITIPYTVSSIGNGAFYSCKSLNTVRFQNSSASATSGSNSACECIDAQTPPVGQPTPCTLTTIPDFCFLNCNAMQELVLPSSVTTIGIEAFNGCKALTSTLAFESIRTIKSRAFQGCSELSSIFIPNSFLSGGKIEELTFNNCSSSLMFYFSAANLAAVNTWAATCPNWGWYKETGDPNVYKYTLTNDNVITGGATSKDDWVYSVQNGEVTIIKYIGPTQKTITTIDPVEGTSTKTTSDVIYLSVPDHLPTDSNQPVRYIQNDAFSSVRSKLKRLYLPTTLKQINKGMFGDSYSVLETVASNLECSTDSTNLSLNNGLYRKKIDLHNLTELEFICDEAFYAMKQYASIQMIHLPYFLKYVGDFAFGHEGNAYHMRNVTEFIWDYNEDNSQLVAIGRDAFFKLGSQDTNQKIDDKPHSTHRINPSNGNTKYTLSTIIFPRTFRSTGFTKGEKDERNAPKGNAQLGGDQQLGTSGKVGDHAFAGCPLIEKVIIKGSTKETLDNGGITKDPDAADLFLSVQSFTGNESLRTFVVEERKGHAVLFHTQQGRWNQPCIGWNGGRFKDDFSGDPNLQIIVLPNKNTTLMVHEIAFQGNSRASIYLSSTESKIYKNTAVKSPTVIPGSGDLVANGVATDSMCWRMIGDEAYHPNGQNGGNYLANTNTLYGYIGYCFSGTANPASADASITNRFGLNQQIPIYENVHYKETIKDGSDNTITTVEVGSGSANDLIIDEAGKCAYVCDASSNNTGDATMTKYLFDNYDTSFNGTAVIKKTINNYANKPRTVKAIGDSAFSACYCDYTTSGRTALTSVKVPDTIESIGDYAFMRAYGITKVTAYASDPASAHADYTMPENLEYIGKHAFAFCNIEKFLDIPDDCLFYENKNETDDYETSAFSNNFSLRAITFAPENNEDTDPYSSTYYEVTHYTHSTGVEYTSALYSKASVDYNKDRLLLVLYRDSGDKTKEADDLEETTVDTVKYGIFDGGYKSNPCLYGAFKMGYWIDYLTVGVPTIEKDSDPEVYLSQPYFSGVCTRTTTSNCADAPLYLYTPVEDYKNQLCDLKVVSINMSSGLNLQPDAWAGTDNTIEMSLPQSDNGVIPEGVFQGSEAWNFLVPEDDAVSDWKTCSGGEIDLTYNHYAGIGANAFKESEFTSLIAPIWTSFTVGANAFENCTDLTSIDFSNVTGDVTIGSEAFKGCTALTTINFNCEDANLSLTKTITISADAFNGCTNLTSINFDSAATVIIGDSAFSAATIKSSGAGFTWPVSTNSKTVSITFGDSAFAGCNFENHTVILPEDLSSMGSSCFSGCTSIQTVTATDDLTKLTSISASAFNGCTSLVDFDFDKFTNITSIGDNAFKMTSSAHPIIATYGIIDLPASVTSIGTSAFEYSGVVKVYVNSSSLSLGQYAFRNCASLELFYFNDKDCSWSPSASGYFDNCTSLQELWLPSNGPALNNSNGSFVNGAASTAIIYANETYTSNTTTDWREYNTGSDLLLNISYYASDNDELLIDDGNGNYTGLNFSVNNTSLTFWTFDGTGEEHSNVIYLGYVDCYDLTDGTVHFSGGWTLDSDGNFTQETTQDYKDDHPNQIDHN